jgi:hypothetical protein
MQWYDLLRSYVSACPFAENCGIRSAQVDLRSRLVRKIPKSDPPKYRVSTEVAAIWALKSQHILPGNELLIDYGNLFWKEEPEHCVVCFSRKWEGSDNLMIQCEAINAETNEACTVSRHRLCCNPVPTMHEVSEESNIHFFCPDHLAAQSDSEPVRPSSSASVIASKSQPSSAPKMNKPTWSPVPSAAPSGRSTAAVPVRAPHLISNPNWSPTPSIIRPAVAVNASVPKPSAGTIRAPNWSPAPSAAAAGPGVGDSTASASAPPPHSGSVPVRRAIAFSHVPIASVPDTKRTNSSFPPLHSGCVNSAAIAVRNGVSAASADPRGADVEAQPRLSAAEKPQVEEADGSDDGSDAEWMLDDNVRRGMYNSRASGCRNSDGSSTDSSSDSDSASDSASDNGSVASADRERLAGGYRSMSKRSIISPAEQAMLTAEAASICDAEKIAGDAKPRPKLVVREIPDAKLLADYTVNSSLPEAARARVEEELKKYALLVPKTWFIAEKDVKKYRPQPPRRNPRKPAAAPRPLQRSQSVSSVQSSSGGSAPMNIDDDDGTASVMSQIGSLHAPPAGSGSVASDKSTSDRWKLPGDLAHDYGEYRSCCGAVATTDLEWATLSRELRIGHSSHSAMMLFARRLEHRNLFANRGSFDAAVRQTLLEMPADGKVTWFGCRICCSCFRAVLGAGRGWLFRLVNQPDRFTQAAVPELTLGGQLRKERLAPVLNRTMRLIRNFCREFGQRLPNPKGMDPTRQRYYVPQRTWHELCEALSEFEREKRTLKDALEVPLHALGRAKKELSKHNYYISLAGSGTQLCRCSICDKIDNQTTPAHVKKRSLTRQQVMSLKASKLAHLRQMIAQRNHFEEHKKLAMTKPTECMTITLDGMDQKTTQLPSKARYSKEMESKARLKVHTVGAFCFGGSVPVMGLLNFPDLRKDSALSCTLMDSILNAQWEGNENRRRSAAAAVPGSPAQGAAQDPAVRSASSGAMPAEEEESKESDAAPARAVSVEDGGESDAEMDATPDAPAFRFEESSSAKPAPYAREGDDWPRRLHVTFDNAGGECKNQWMIRYLGLLVLHRVFLEVTISTLLVGHTHDIVDQMFSVWSRLLRIENAETYEKMRDLFRNRYHSKIEGLVELARGREEAYAALAPDARSTCVKERKENPDDWVEQDAEDLQEYTETIQAMAKGEELTPHIQLQSVSMDVKGWLPRALPKTEKKLPSLGNLTEVHNMGIEMDEVGNVWLYNKAYADSTNRKSDGSVHHYTGMATGDWSTRALLWPAGSQMSDNPLRLPPLAVDTAELRKTGIAFKQHDAMNWDQLSEFNGTLQALDDAQVKQTKDCPTCSELLKAYGRHGVVSQSKRQSAEERKAAHIKIKSRTQAWEAMEAHLSDPAFEKLHGDNMVLHNMWTKWLERAKHHIIPSYIQRGILLNPVELEENLFHPSPLALVSSPGEKPVHIDHEVRVDLVRLKERGPPKAGQIALVRTDKAREPFYVAVIDEVIEKERQESDAAAVEGDAASSKPNLRLKDFKLKVRYYDLKLSDWAELHLATGKEQGYEKAGAPNNKWWKDKFAKNAEGTEAELQAAILASMVAKTKPPKYPAWLFDSYEFVKFVPPVSEKKQKKKQKPVILPAAAVIAWDWPDQVLNKKNRAGERLINRNYWKQMRLDLVGADAVPSQPSQRGRNKDDKDAESDGEFRIDFDMTNRGAAAASSAAAPAAAVPFRHTARPNRAKVVQYAESSSSESEEEGVAPASESDSDVEQRHYDAELAEEAAAAKVAAAAEAAAFAELEESDAVAEAAAAAAAAVAELDDPMQEDEMIGPGASRPVVEKRKLPAAAATAGAAPLLKRPRGGRRVRARN